MALKEVLEVVDLFDDAKVSGDQVVQLLAAYPGVTVSTQRVTTAKGGTDFVRIDIPGAAGKSTGGQARTLGVIGRLGGIGARPDRIGLVSDGDGAVAAVATALKLARMHERGDQLAGDVVIATHICPDAPTLPHEPVEFMDSPVDIATMNAHEVIPEMDAILSIDTTKGNRIVNHRGVAVSAPVLGGYILRFSEDLLRILETVSGVPAQTLPITTQDITPYGNGVHHINSILQPAVTAQVPVVGVAITAQSVVPGSATGASHETDIALAARFAIEVAKEFSIERAAFIDEAEYASLVDLYGSLEHLYVSPARV
ncbi:DUF1177 domain-containing protein [Brevibacterium luteolum]|uniref:DUF1177 domain-containing protein n=1 Tax=Brevibacterium luteolum TaxID=199591 RepID=A0A2N6PE41_9MICO|nr:DUF1177 domain-containing protein [Brevibacterium luteolum]PMB96936.1 DUF1177 domain-containing protein [Brevibacterium luteolum]